MPTISPLIDNMVKGLVTHLLQGRTIEQAIEEGREVGMPEELLDSLPGMVFEATSAAGAVHVGERTMAQVLDVMVERGAPREDAEELVRLVLDFIAALETEIGSDKPVPNSGRRWFEYEGKCGSEENERTRTHKKSAPTSVAVQAKSAGRKKERSRRVRN